MRMSESTACSEPRYVSGPGIGNFKQVQKLPNVETFELKTSHFWELQGFAIIGQILSPDAL